MAPAYEWPVIPISDDIKNQVLPKIAVCLAAFNGVRWLPEQLDSILEQTGVLVTVIVSVDCSTDGTEDWINHRANEDERIVVLPHGQRFGGAAKNFFRLFKDVDFSGFDYVSLADQDDIWLPEKLVHAHEMLLQTGADAYSSDVTAFWPSGRKCLIKKSQPQRRWDFLFEAAGPGCTYVLKAELARAIQTLVLTRWNEVQGIGLHDWLLYAYARWNGYRWIIDEHSGMLYRQHEENQVGVNTGWRAFLHRVHKVISGWGLGQAALIVDLVGMGDDPFVRRWVGKGRVGTLWLALHAGMCRRRARDRALFICSNLMLSVIGRGNETAEYKDS